MTIETVRLMSAAPRSPTCLAMLALAGGCRPTSKPAARAQIMASVRDIAEADSAREDKTLPPLDADDFRGAARS